MCVGERGGGAALFAKKCDYVNANHLTESWRSERVESAIDFVEILKDKATLNVFYRLPQHFFKMLRNDGIGMDWHESQSDSRNNENGSDSTQTNANSRFSQRQH